jgi:hypothetical protein
MTDKLCIINIYEIRATIHEPLKPRDRQHSRNYRSIFRALKHVNQSKSTYSIPPPQSQYFHMRNIKVKKLPV